MNQSRNDNQVVDVAIITPLLVAHVLVFLLLPSLITEIIYMLGYVASLAIASTRREYRHILIIPVAGFAVGLTSEVAGVNTGIPFGRYEYVSLTAPRVLGVPLSVPVMWGFYAYLTYLIASSVIRGKSIIGITLRVMYASLLMVTLDLAMDPFMVNKIHAWVWLDGWGPTWFGIPVSNFIGWFIVSFAIFLIHEVMARNSSSPRITTAIPYACLVMFFASFIGSELAAPIAALLVTLLAVPIIVKNLCRPVKTSTTETTEDP
ncbi:MAG TPA: carotenoid biosynthesis protein [Candidatus Bathyarchaeota archaeon]|nr:carotenoid biosynthesis protein [Candidatus Bathyarchaeota archaeon]